MLAICFDGKVTLRSDHPRPRAARSEVLIAVRKAGICATDLEVARGYMHFRGVMGHEFVGTVVAGSRPWKGTRVVAEINCLCGRCDMCRSGLGNHCRNRTALGIDGRDGAFADYLTLPVRNLVAVPDDLPDEIAIFTEPLAAACEILQQVHIRPTDRVVVLGDGRLGLLCAQVVSLTGCDLVIVGHHLEKMYLMAQMGIPVALADELVNPGADVLIEATGNPSGYAAVRRLVRPRGTVVLKSTYHGSFDANLTTAVVDEVTLVGSRCGPFAPALRLLQRGLVDVKPFITARYPLIEVMTALEHAARPEALKVLVEA